MNDHSRDWAGNDLDAWLQLTLVPGISPRQQQALLRTFGTPHQVLAETPAAVEAVLGAEAAAALAKGAEPALLDRTERWLQEPGHHLLALGDPAYPSALLQIAVPPTVLYARGRIELLNAPTFAIVGSRNATPQGQRDAQDFARTLSDSGFCIASGLALGIDAAAHRGGLEGASASIAVIGTGADRDYPRRNGALAARLAREGCIVSEFPIGTPPLEENFPRRNRLISGLSRGVLLVEAARRSGSLITAGYALQQDRDVFAVPGSIHSSLSKGCHALIKEGATLVEHAHDILLEYRMAMPSPAPHPSTSRSERSHPVLDAMDSAPMSLDQVARRAKMGPADAAAALARLEVEGRVCALAGGWFQRAMKGAAPVSPGGSAVPRVIE
jgi:DNA processing protein